MALTKTLNPIRKKEQGSILIRSDVTLDVVGVSSTETLQYAKDANLSTLTLWLAVLTVVDRATDEIAVTTLEGANIPLNKVYMKAEALNGTVAYYPIRESLPVGKYRYFIQWAKDDSSAVRLYQETVEGEFEVEALGTGAPSKIAT